LILSNDFSEACGIAVYIEAMGGKLRLVVEFPDRKPVTLADLDSLGTHTKPAPRNRKPTNEHAPV
jgi:hypothetical protein